PCQTGDQGHPTARREARRRRLGEARARLWLRCVCGGDRAGSCGCARCRAQIRPHHRDRCPHRSVGLCGAIQCAKRTLRLLRPRPGACLGLAPTPSGLASVDCRSRPPLIATRCAKGRQLPQQTCDVHRGWPDVGRKLATPRAQLQPGFLHRILEAAARHLEVSMARLKIAAAVWLLGVTAAFAQDKVRFQTDWIPSGEHAMYYGGWQKGIFASEGIDITITRGYGSGDTVTKLAAGAFDFGVADMAAVMTGQGRQSGPGQNNVVLLPPAPPPPVFAKRLGMTKFYRLVGQKKRLTTAD